MNGETTTETPTVEAPPAFTPPPVTPEPPKHKAPDIKNPWLILVVIAVVIVAAFLLFGGKDDGPANNFNLTSFEGLSGVQGMVRYIDYANQKFTTERIVLIEDDGEYQTQRDIFNFQWDENTRFLYYRNSLALEASQAWEVNQTFLTTSRNVIVSTQEKPATDKELTALEIRILPGSTQAGASN